MSNPIDHPGGRSFGMVQVEVDPNLKGDEWYLTNAPKEVSAANHYTPYVDLQQRVKELEAALLAADRVMWMAKQWADGGGSGGPEMREYKEVEAIVVSALGGLLK